MRVLIDTNVILDLFLQRPGYAEEAAALWKANGNRQIEGFVAAITPINLFYFARKTKGREQARQAVVDLLASMQVCRLDQQIFHAALALPVTDYEDAVQMASAVDTQLEAIVTRNLKDYKNSPLPVYSPSDFLALLAAKEQ
jgi:predicted nucleic acid-binding protein